MQCWPLTKLRCLGILICTAVVFFVICYNVSYMRLMTVKSLRIVTFQETTQQTSGHRSGYPFQQSNITYIGHMVDTSQQADWLKAVSILHKVPNINCPALFNGSKTDIERAKMIAANVSLPVSDEDYMELTTDCHSFVKTRGYILSSLTKEEEDFPLAFSILVFKDAEMVERLLRAIYRPQNYYCIHVDKKSPDSFYQVVAAIAKCFSNVFIVNARIDVRWGEFSVLEPEIKCIQALWRYPKWKYFFTLTGQEFPLKTNLELVKILTVYNGANDIEGTIKRANKDRFRTQPPLGLRPIKGSVHITVNRDFVDYMLHNDTAKALLEWAKTNTSVPDETFFATLNHNPQLRIRGSFTGDPDIDSVKKPFLTRFKDWGSSECSAGVFVRAICILTLGDLQRMGAAKHYFANKFYLSQDRVVIGCLEEKIFNDTRDEYLGLKTFDTSYYSNLYFLNYTIH